VLPSGEVQVYSRLGCCLNMVLARANSCSKQKSSSCSSASFVSPKPYRPTADDTADGSLLPTWRWSRPLRAACPSWGLVWLLETSLGRTSPVLLPWLLSLVHTLMTIHRSKSKQEIEFPYGGRPHSKAEVVLSQPWIEICHRNLASK